MRSRRKFMVVPFGGIALFLSMGAIAFACTNFQGTMTVSGNAGGTTTSFAVRNGPSQRVSKGITKATSTNGSFAVSTGTEGCCNRLPDRESTTLQPKNYFVRFYNSTAANPGYKNHFTPFTPCWYGAPGVPIGNVRLNGNGEINQKLVANAWTPVSQPVVFGLPDGLRKDVAPAESEVCISDNFAAFANIVPLTII